MPRVPGDSLAERFPLREASHGRRGKRIAVNGILTAVYFGVGYLLSLKVPLHFSKYLPRC